jgi:chemotaxis methyl-accepting protein methylase
MRHRAEQPRDGGSRRTGVGVTHVAPTLPAGLIPDDEPGFAALLAKITRERGFACASYKDKCLRRRIAVRLRNRGLAGYREYAALLDTDAAEYDKLLDTLTINVTRLFRNWSTYAALQRAIIPAIWERPDRTINVWSAGCASGEEAYSLAVLFRHHARSLDTPERPSRVRVLGTDIDRASLRSAAIGAYAEAAFVDAPTALRASHFSAGWPATVDDEVRALVRFERHDVIRDPAPPGQHLIACRNVIIYFDRPTQEALFERFHAALVPGGYLVLGKVETLMGDWRARFSPVDARERIYQRV